MNALPELKVSDLPSSAQTIAEVIGVEATLRLCARFSSPQMNRDRLLYVPSIDRLTGGHPIAQALGLETAQRLSRYFSGENIFIPSCTYAIRRASIWASFMAGKSVREVSESVGVSERRVRQVTAEERGTSQSDRFRLGGMAKTEAKATASRKNGAMAAKQISTMRSILSRLRSTPATPYGSLLATIGVFAPRLTLIVNETQEIVITTEKAVEMMASRLPGQIQILHGDRATIMSLQPAKTAGRKEPLTLRVETTEDSKAMSKNAWVINSLEALAISAVIDRNAEMKMDGVKQTF